jgi:hypothetical protein
MSEQEVVALMESSKSESEWNRNCDQVKQKCGGYPEFWFPLIVMSGLSQRVAASFGSNADIHVSSFPS